MTVKSKVPLLRLLTLHFSHSADTLIQRDLQEKLGLSAGSGIKTRDLSVTDLMLLITRLPDPLPDPLRNKRLASIFTVI